jgi:predicted metal-dependent hydrolase
MPMQIINGDVISSTDAYQMAVGKMGHDLAMKYADYFSKKQKAIKTGRLQNSYVDSGRNKVYKSEWATEAKFPEVKKSMTEKEITKFFKRVVKSKTYQTLSEKGSSNPRLEFMKTVKYNARIAGQATYSMVRLQPSCGMTKWVVLHELAHTAGHMHHDVPFRQTLVKLISRFLGTEVAKELKRQFRARKVKMTVSQVIMSPEKWLDNYNKMAALRAKRG